MIIVDIVQYDKRKVLVQTDEHLVFPLYKTEIQSLRLSKGQSIPKEVYVEITERILPKRIILRAMHLLEKRDYTRQTLKRKLLEGKYPEQLVENALDYLTKCCYIDDLKYAETYIQCYCTKRSKMRIAYDLSVKGVAKEVIEEAFNRCEVQNGSVDETEQILKILSKKQYNAHTADYKEKAKMINYLCRKGYSLNTIQKCIQFSEEYAD